MNLIKVIESRQKELVHYNPIFFFKEENNSYDFFVKNRILGFKEDGSILFEVEFDGENFIFIYRHLPWDSNFFELETFRLDFVLYSSKDVKLITKAVSEFLHTVVGDSYLFTDIPCEDILLIQALNLSGCRLVETRMTYYLNLHSFDYERFSVRAARIDDIPNLKKTAVEMVNPFDRFHADVMIPDDKADLFLGEFAEASIRGFADVVLVPDVADLSSDSFVTGKYLMDMWENVGINFSKMVLSAVSSTTNKGWYLKLIVEMAFLFKSKGAKFAIMHPASTNGAVIHTYEKLGCKLGKVSHIFSYKYD